MSNVTFDSPQNAQMDMINTLPIDKSVPSQTEIQIVDTLFPKKHTAIQQFFGKSKDVLIIGLLYIIFAIPYTDDLIKKLIPSTQTSIYLLVLVKTIAFMLLFFIIQNWYLCRKK